MPSPEPTALLVVGLLAHQLGRLWEQGFVGAHHNYAPVFAVSAPKELTFAGQVVALPAALVAIVVVPAPAGPLVALALVLFWLFTVQRRLANHCWLGVVALVAMVFVPQSTHAVVARDLLVGLYLSAALFKLNSEYLFTNHSAGRVVTRFYLGLLGLRMPHALLRPVPALVILAEFLTGLSLLDRDFAPAGLVLAVAMHLAFGVSGNFGFSTVALVLWVVALASDSHGVAVPPVNSVWWVAVAVSAVLALLLGRTAAGRRSVSLLAKDLVQGATFGALCSIAFGAPAGRADWTGPLVHVLVGALFVVNFALVMVGAKLEWSFAMFSSLRPFGRSWLQRRWFTDWPRYYVLTLPDRIPVSLVKTVRPDFLYQATRPDNAVHESVVRRLEAVANRYDTTLMPVVVEPRDGELVPSTRAEQPPPRRTVLLFPAIVPRSFAKCYLG
jgi:hypothetical protein